MVASTFALLIKETIFQNHGLQNGNSENDTQTIINEKKPWIVKDGSKVSDNYESKIWLDQNPEN